MTDGVWVFWISSPTYADCCSQRRPKLNVKFGRICHESERYSAMLRFVVLDVRSSTRLHSVPPPPHRLWSLAIGKSLLGSRSLSESICSWVSVGPGRTFCT